MRKFGILVMDRDLWTDKMLRWLFQNVGYLDKQWIFDNSIDVSSNKNSIRLIFVEEEDMTAFRLIFKV